MPLASVARVTEDDPLPGLESTRLGPPARGPAGPGNTDGLDARAQGGPLPEWWEEAYEAWLEQLRQTGPRSPVDQDPLPLRGGEVCDRCEDLAVLATEHVWDQAPSAIADLASDRPWRSGVLFWCARHARRHDLDLLATGAVVIGTRGSGV